MSRRETERQHSEYVRLMKSMFEFLLTSGMEVKAIRGIVERALIDEGERGRRALYPGDFGLATAGRVLDRWHRSRRYTTERAVPRAIPLLGRAPSVEALVRSENARVDSAEFARRLKSLGFLIRAEGSRYKPAARIAVVAGLNPLIQEYVARSSSTLLQTIRHNISLPNRSQKLIERFAEVPDLPAGCETAFREAHLQDLQHLLELEFDLRLHGHRQAVQLEYGSGVLEIKALAQLPVGLVHRVRDLVGVELRNHIK